MSSLTPLTGADRLYHDDRRPLQFESGQGPFVHETDGTRYVDYICGTGPVILGHGHPEFIRRVSASLERGLCLPGYGAPHSRLAERFEALHPGKAVVSFFKSSSDAMSSAVRCSAAITGRSMILRCGFLGWHDALIAKTPYWHEQLDSSRRLEIRYTKGYRGVAGAEEVLNWNDLSLESLERILAEYGPQISLFAFDVFQLAFTSEAVLQQAVRLCRSHGVFVVFDETKTGGRIGPAGFLKDFDEQPDFIVLGKAIGNGAPISMLLANTAQREIFAEARIGGTYAKELFSISAANHVMDIMAETDGYAALRSGIQVIVSAFNDAAHSLALSGSVHAAPLFNETVFEVRWNPQFVNNFEARKAFVSALRKAGVLLLDGHCSFAGTSHMEFIKKDELAERLARGMADWKRSCP